MQLSTQVVCFEMSIRQFSHKPTLSQQRAQTLPSYR